MKPALLVVPKRVCPVVVVAPATHTNELVAFPNAPALVPVGFVPRATLKILRARFRAGRNVAENQAKKFSELGVVVADVRPIMR